MKKQTISLALAVGLSYMLYVPGAEAQEESGCTVEIRTPKAGDQVGLRGRVRGTAVIPDSTHLWVLAHMKDLVREWWPQGGRPAVIEPDGEWVILATYGGSQDVGELFEVAAIVVDDNTNRRLLAWVAEGEESGSYPPIPFPTPVDECVPVKAIVEKVSY